MSFEIQSGSVSGEQETGKKVALLASILSYFLSDVEQDTSVPPSLRSAALMARLELAGEKIDRGLDT